LNRLENARSFVVRRPASKSSKSYREVYRFRSAVSGFWDDSGAKRDEKLRRDFSRSSTFMPSSFCLAGEKSFGGKLSAIRFSRHCSLMSR
jgi:hypothetical protein